MAQESHAEECARQILCAFVALSRRPGAVIRITRFRRRFHQVGYTVDDFQLGMDFAMTRGWIEPSLAASYRLTDAGFAEAL